MRGGAGVARGAVECRRVPREGARRARRRGPIGRHSRLGLLALVVLFAFLYYSPLQRFVETRGDLAARRAEVAELRVERNRLEARLERSTSLEALRREARRIGYVEPDERLFIVKGITQWRRAQARCADDPGACAAP
jgi:cell division protein FtsB